MTMDNTPDSGQIDWKHLFLSFDGRIRRQHFWIGWLILFGVCIVANFLPIIGLLIVIAAIWPNLAVSVKRLHDIGKPGWFVAIPIGISVVGFLASGVMAGAAVAAAGGMVDPSDAAEIMAVAGPAAGIFFIVILINFGFLLWLGLTEGQAGTNQYGPNPKGIG